MKQSISVGILSEQQRFLVSISFYKLVIPHIIFRSKQFRCVIYSIANARLSFVKLRFNHNNIHKKIFSLDD